MANDEIEEGEVNSEPEQNDSSNLEPAEDNENPYEQEDVILAFF